MRKATGSKRKIAPTYDAGSLFHMASTAQPKKPVKQPKGRGKGRKGNGKTADENELSDAEAGSERESDGGGASENGTMASTTRVNEILESLADDEDLRDVAQAHCQFNKKAGVKCLLKLKVETFLSETKLGQVTQGARCDENVVAEYGIYKCWCCTVTIVLKKKHIYIYIYTYIHIQKHHHETIVNRFNQF